MIRVKRGNVARNRHKKILSLASGYRGTHSTLFRIANQQIMKALKYSYIGRKQKKQNFRKIWINRINASSRMKNLSYNRAINKFKNSKITLNKKMLAQIGIFDVLTFELLIMDSGINKNNLEGVYTTTI